MFKKTILLGLCIIMTITAAKTGLADSYLESLKEGQKIHGFSTLNLYDNAQDKAMGARFISDKYGFIVDLLQIESVPQGFFWIKTPPSDDMGEPHTCEHLLLGKGKTGRYVSALEDMSLGTSSAWTAQTNTVYHFNTIAGEETFYKLFEAKLNALLNPDFTDEEIRREVCHVGINIDPGDSSLSLDEKGTVYTEMVSGFEKPSRYLWKELDEILYGPNHPLANSSGGYPPAIRQMKAEDLRKFHSDNYFLGNMGVIVAIPKTIAVDDFLQKLGGILERCQKFEKKSSTTGMTNFDFPPPATLGNPAVTKVIPAPSENPDEPGDVMIAWPAELDYGFFDGLVLDLFMSTFAGGTASNLYNVFINSETRKIDLGANSVFGFSSSDLGHPIMMGLDGVNSDYINEQMLDSIRNMIIAEIRNVYNYKDGSEELKKFNDFARGRMIQSQKQLEKLLNSPPLFGGRLTGGEWQSNLMTLEKEKGFRKSVVLKKHFEKGEQMLASGKNFWREYIDKWKLLKVKPNAMATKPDPTILTKLAHEKQERIEGYIKQYEKKYGVTDEQEAIAKYKADFDKNTAEIEAIAAKDEIPGFIDNPPMTLDDQLDYQVMKLDNGVKMVASNFENMTASQVAIALKLDVIPESQLVYVPYLPTVLSDIGVIKDGEVVKYDDMDNRLREDVLNFNAFFSQGYETGRTELVLRTSGNNLGELQKGIEWMNAALYSPYLSVENLPRMVDVIDQALVSLRNVMKGREENWVRYPAYGYRYQTNPLVMSTSCFLTKVHHYQRLKWLLTDPGTDTDQNEISDYIAELRDLGKGKDREGLKELLNNPPEITTSDVTKKIIPQIIQAMESSLADIPDANLADDWNYLLTETEQDLMVKPEKAIADINSILAQIRKADNARMYMISNSVDRNAILGQINEFAGKLDSKNKSVRIQYAETPRVIEKLESRTGSIDKPVYVGLVNNSTNNGVMIFSARNAERMDTSKESVLKYLGGNLYGGGGGHGLFMKTWGAGLAYSNGYAMGFLSGNASYYAERCPDISETMRFVVDILKNAKKDPDLLDYAIAQAFRASRASSQYESRGASMAEDLEDGYLPENVKAYRQKVLDLRKDPNLIDELYEKMPDAYGSVLIGYGKPLSESKNGSFFIIGPDKQFEYLEDYVGKVEGPQKVYKLYPRDFWLTI